MTEQEYARLVARNIRRIAYDNGKTQADIARDLKISKATVSSWMNGTRVPRVNKIDLLCHYFNCKRSDIMQEHADQEEKNYYINEDARDYAQFLFENPEYRVLFDTTRKIKKEDLEIVKALLDKFS